MVELLMYLYLAFNLKEKYIQGMSVSVKYEELLKK